MQTIDPILIGLIILAVANIILISIVVWLFMKMRRFLINVDAHNISDSLSHVSMNLDELQQFRKEMEDYLTTLENRVRKSVQSVHTIRFNPFKGTGAGGNQSFATAFLNEEGDGVIISSLYSRDHVSVFSKPIINNESEHELSDEEREALTESRKKINKKAL